MEIDTGTTGDDHFIGVVSDTPIAQAEITTFNVGGFFEGDTIEFEIDHVQYGLQVPEPAAMCHSVMLLAVLVLCRANSKGVGRGTQSVPCRGSCRAI